MKKKFITRQKRFSKKKSPRTSKKLLVFNASPRGKDGFGFFVAQNLKPSKILNLANYKIFPCDGCLSCKNGKCHFKDDFEKIFSQMKKFDDITFVSPVYFSGIPSTLKSFIDRCELFWEKKQKPLAGKKISLILTAERKKIKKEAISLPLRAFAATVGASWGGVKVEKIKWD